MTDEPTRAFPLEPRTSPIPLRKQPESNDQRANPGQSAAPSNVVVPANNSPYTGPAGPQQGYPQQNFAPQNFQQGYHQQGYAPPGPNPYFHGSGGYPPQQYAQPVPYTQPPMYGPGYGSTAIMTRPAPNGALVAVAWVVAVFTGFYMLPWAVAATRSKSNQAAIGLLNFFLGWTFIGWVVALIMACTSEPQPVVMVQQNHYQNGYYR